MALFSGKSVKKITRKLGDSANELFNRSLDKHVSLAVTGLSQSGKTAFITSVVNQLINEGSGQPLAFFDVVHQGRFIGAKRVRQKHLHIPRFDYEAAMANLSSEEPMWPDATRSISELRLAMRYYPNEGMLKYATDMATVYLDITDYPGEWLLDLPMLELDFQQWSEQMKELLFAEPRYQLSQEFLQKLEQLDPFAPVDEKVLAALSAEYTQLLHKFRYQLGMSVIQPGRFILPGEHEGAPILQFVPFVHFEQLDMAKYRSADQDSMIGMLRARYLEYRERIVRRFYKKHFARFDRQIILIDTLTPLNNGSDAFNDLQHAISLIMESFSYGQSSLLSRLFSPKIDKLMFAATKADHITADQHSRLLSLLEQVVHKAKKTLSFDAIKMKSLAIASVKTTEQGKSEYQGQQLSVVKGKRADTGQVITLYPGAVPTKLPDANNWPDKGFNFIAFKPITAADEHIALAHIRLDQVLQFLLGDKLK
ncbi:YcjX family protein [Thalassotalea sp. HSM 43]|uniref:YcjX family protein n=1 Tax=Thalassotalea sp. HSM 43 TaxID=2552945 RepID=UPI001080BE5C|nr:YcjX family protein [Thalassotalea sp. HSM 43]QBY05310.1 YcjX family protein [Thalassotalea sp. HSM 43]